MVRCTNLLCLPSDYVDACYFFILVVANLLKGAQDRLNRVHQNCLKETAKRRTLLEPGPATATVPQLK